MKPTFTSPIRITITIILSLIGIHVGLWLGRTYLPGFAGEWCGKLQGFAFTPFIMEFLLMVFGFMAVLVINQVRQHREGEEFITLEVRTPPSDSNEHRIELSSNASERRRKGKI